MDEGDLVSVAEGGTAVIEYRDGCRYTVTGGGSGVEYIVNHAQCICYESLDLSKHSRHDAVAELGRINGKAMVAVETPYIDGVEGTELKEGHRVMTLEDSSARVEYYFGCDYTLGEGETYTVDAEVCCLALGLPKEEALMDSPLQLPPPSAIVPALAVITGIVAIIPDDDEDPPPVPISP